MQSRPLRVRMEAADKAGLSEAEKKDMMAAGADKDTREDSTEMDLDVIMDRVQPSHENEDMDIMGEMEGF